MKRVAYVAVFILLIVAAYPPLRATVAGAVTGTNTTNGSYGVLGSTTGGVYGYNPNNFASAVYGESAAAQGAGVYGVGYNGIQGETSIIGGSAVYGFSGTTQDGAGVYGEGDGTVANQSYGVYGYAPAGIAIYGVSNTGVGGGWAGYFSGPVNITGTLYKSAGAFRIDHPLDPSNKYLSHSFVESDEMKNVYDGVVILRKGGESVIELPKWFEALNRDFRYQLTCIGEHAPVYIADEISDNRFRIAGGYEGMKVSWQVTGVRRDPYAVAHPIVVESLKPLEERGRLLHPDLYKMPESAGIDYMRSRARRRMFR
jgi:hypothetical protein